MFTGYGGLVADAAAHLAAGRRVVTPALGGLLALGLLWAWKRWGPDQQAVEYVDAIRNGVGRIPLLATVARMGASALSVATGAAIGREGAMIQFGSAVTSAAVGLWEGWRGMVAPEARVRVLAYAVSGAVGSVYGAPMAGAFFAAEIGQGRIVWGEMVPLLAAGCVGAACRHTLLEHGALFQMPGTLRFGWADCLPGLLLAGLAGVLAPVYYKALHGAAMLKRVPLAMVWAGLLVGLLSLVRAEVWGNGESAILDLVRGHWGVAVVATVLGMRLMAVTACEGAGVVGGVFTPTVFVGAAVGFLWARSLLGFGMEPMLYVVLGIGCFLAAVTHAPVMAALMAAELTGTLKLLPVLLIGSYLAREISRRIVPASLYGVAASGPVRAR
jgi:CIC family chloride channel protein